MNMIGAKSEDLKIQGVLKQGTKIEGNQSRSRSQKTG
jgi:hypothetical protein